MNVFIWRKNNVSFSRYLDFCNFIESRFQNLWRHHRHFYLKKVAAITNMYFIFLRITICKHVFRTIHIIIWIRRTGIATIRFSYLWAMSFFRVFPVFFFIWFLLNLKTEGIDPFTNDFFPYTCFFSVSNTFISNARLKLTKIKKKAKLPPHTTLLKKLLWHRYFLWILWNS